MFDPFGSNKNDNEGILLRFGVERICRSMK
jgi:hypothetical protein